MKLKVTSTTPLKGKELSVIGSMPHITDERYRLAENEKCSGWQYIFDESLSKVVGYYDHKNYVEDLLNWQQAEASLREFLIVDEAAVKYAKTHSFGADDKWIKHSEFMLEMCYLSAKETHPYSLDDMRKAIEFGNIEDCAKWLAYCLSIGWSKDNLDALEEIWWKHHDEKGNLIRKINQQPKS